MYNLEHKGSRLVGSFFAENEEFKLKYFGKLIENNNVICLQEVHGKDEFLQAIQVLAMRFKLIGMLIPGNENAGGSAICIHKDLLPEDAIVTHMITYCERTVWSETSSDR